MTFEQFWALTPADVQLAVEAADQRERADYWRAGLIASAILNVNRRKGARAVKPDDFVPHRRRRQTPERMAQLLKAMTVALGGEVHDGH